MAKDIEYRGSPTKRGFPWQARRNTVTGQRAHGPEARGRTPKGRRRRRRHEAPTGDRRQGWERERQRGFPSSIQPQCFAARDHLDRDEIAVAEPLASASRRPLGFPAHPGRACRGPDAQHDGFVAVRLLVLRGHDRLGGAEHAASPARRSSQGFRPYPYLLLNLFLSMLAGVQAAALLIAAKRADAISSEIALHTENNTDDIKTLISENTALTESVKTNADLLQEIHLHVANIGKKVGAEMGRFPPAGTPNPAKTGRIDLADRRRRCARGQRSRRRPPTPDSRESRLVSWCFAHRCSRARFILRPIAPFEIDRLGAACGDQVAQDCLVLRTPALAAFAPFSMPTECRKDICEVSDLPFRARRSTVLADRGAAEGRDRPGLGRAPT